MQKISLLIAILSSLFISCAFAGPAKEKSNAIKDSCSQVIQELSKLGEYKDIKGFDDPKLLAACETVSSIVFKECTDDLNQKYELVISAASRQPEAKRLPKFAGALIEFCGAQTAIFAYESVKFLAIEAKSNMNSISEALKAREKKKSGK